MRTLQKTIYYKSRSDRIVFWHLTDTHIGAAACDEKMLKADVSYIASHPNAYWGFGGDACEFIPRRGDKRYRESSIARWLWGKNDVVGEQIERFSKIIAPIANKCLYFLKGNHEDAMLTYHDRDVYVELLRRLANAAGGEIGDFALGWEGFTVIRFRRGTPERYGGTTKLTIYAHHGSGGGRKHGGHALRMEEAMLTYNADLIFLGHRHYRDSSEKVVISPQGRGIREHRRLGVWGGSYMAAHIKPYKNGLPRDNYAQSKQLPPRPVGMMPIIIKPDTLDFTPVMADRPRAMVEALVS